jgi:hypothetical protein
VSPRLTTALANLILAEPKVGTPFMPHRVLDELSVTIGTEIVAASLVQLVADRFVLDIVEPFQDFLYFQQMVAIILEFVDFQRFHGSLYFQPHHVPKLFFGIDDSLAAIARVMDHHSESLREQ